MISNKEVPGMRGMSEADMVTLKEYCYMIAGFCWPIANKNKPMTEIIADIGATMFTGGLLMTEIDHPQAKAVRKLLRKMLKESEAHDQETTP